MELVYVDCEEIGTIIFTLRKKYNMTQEQLAQYLSVNRETISKWERGIYIPSLQFLIEISRIFEVSLDDIIKKDKKEI